jgi:predicted membrane-bound mannosyltransferase
MTVRSSRWQAALLLLVALLLRVPLFGDPVIHSDEQFYLLVGDRLLHGAWPYLDIWDRKPPGLFLLYAAIRLVGGLGIVQYQMVASLAAAATI